MAPQTITWARCQRGGTSRAAQSTAQTGVLSGVVRTVGALPTDVALTPTSPTTSAAQMTSTRRSASATGYGNSRGEADLCLKKRSGGAGALGPRFLLITGSSVRGTAGVPPEDPQEHGKAEDQETRGFLGTLRTRAFGGAEKKASEEAPHHDMKLVPLPEEGMGFRVLRTLVQRRASMPLMTLPEEEISEAEVEVLREEEGRVFSPHLMSSLALKEEGNQILGMEIESQGRVTNISATLPVPTILLMTATPQLAENVLLLSKAWTWHRCHPGSVPGTMG